jgi:adenosylhomocysteine nucleosidase
MTFFSLGPRIPSILRTMKTLIITALHGEIKLILSHFDARKMTKLGGPTRLYECNENIACLTIGMGLTRAEKSMSKFLALYKPDLVLQIGVSGALHPDLKIGDYVIPHTIHAIGESGILCLDDINVTESEVEVKKGHFWSSHHIIESASEKQHIQDKTQSIAVDMESYAVAKACLDAGIRYNSLRIISDLANDSARDDFKINFLKTSNLLQEFMLQNIVPVFNL